MAFDPDKYLKNKNQGSESGFDPDAYLAKTNEQPEEEGFFDSPESMGKGLLKGAGKALDYVDGLARTTMMDSPVGKTYLAALSSLTRDKGFLESLAEIESGATERMKKALLGEAETTSERLEQAGVGELGSVNLPIIGEVTGRGAIGLVGDFGMSPLNAVGGGLAKAAAKPGAKMATKLLNFLANPLEGAIKSGRGALSAASKAAGATGEGVRWVGQKTLKGVGRGLQFGAKKTAKGLGGLVGGKEAGEVAEAAIESIPETFEALARSTDLIEVPEFAKRLQTAKRLGINAEDLAPSVRYGDESLISNVYKDKAQDFLSPESAAIRQSHAKAVDAIQEGTYNYLEQISKGPVLNETAAGSVLRESYDQARKNLFDQMDITYKNIEKLQPGMQISEGAFNKAQKVINGQKRKLAGIINRPPTREAASQAKLLTKELENAERLLARGSYKQVREVMQALGETSFGRSTVGVFDPVARTRQKLYFAMSDALNDSASDFLGKEVGEQLSRNNKIMSDFFKQEGTFFKKFANEQLSDEQLFQQLIKSGNTKQLGELKQFLNEYSPGTWEKMKGAFVDSLLRETKDGGFSFGNLRNALKNSRQKNIFTTVLEPDEVKFLEDIVDLGEAQGNYILNTSGTETARRLGQPKEAFERNLQRKMLEKRLAQKQASQGQKVLDITDVPRDSGVLKDIGEDVTRARAARDFVPPSLATPSTGQAANRGVFELIRQLQLNSTRQDRRNEQNDGMGAMRRRLNQ